MYTSFDGSYTALFPGKPKEEVNKSTQTKFITTRVAYRTPDNKYYYTIETNKYLKKLSKKEINALLKFLYEDNSTGTEGFEYKRRFIFNDYDAHEYITYDNKWNGAVKTRIFFDVRQSTLYKISVGTGGEGIPSGSLDTPEIESFLDSLKLKK